MGWSVSCLLWRFWRLSRRLQGRVTEILATGPRAFYGGARTAHAIAGKSQRIIGLPEDIEFDSSKHLVQNPASVHGTAGESEEVTGLLEVRESDFPMRAGAAATAAATAGDSEGIIGFRVSESSLCVPTNSLNSSGSVDMDVHVILLSPLPLRLGPHLLVLRLLLLLHMRAPHPCMLHTIRGRTRGRVKGPTGRRSTKGGVPVRPKICALSQRWRQG